MFGFTCHFATVQTNKPIVSWKSMTEFSKILRKIGKGLRNLEQFDDAMNDLHNILTKLYKTNGFSQCEWITNHNLVTIRDLVFVHIQTIGHIFIQNEEQNVTKSLKTDISNYRVFFENIMRLISSKSFNLFTKKQIKKMNELKESVMNYTNDYQLSIIEKQNDLLKQKQSAFHQNINTSTDAHIDIIQKLRSKLSKTRIERCEMVLKHRTDRVILILDQCYDVRNQCAMLRSAELFGIQHIWIIKPINYKNCKVYDSISRRAQLWLTLRYFDSTLECIDALKKEEKHRKVWVMDIGKDALELGSQTIDEYRNKSRIFPQYLAIVMGKEAEGPSNDFMEYCDEKVFLPQFGFCESYNVSVACALGLHSIFAMNEEMRGKMDEKERNKLRYLWYKQLCNDKQIKHEMDQIMHKSIGINRDTNMESDLQNDFRRNEFKHWESKKATFRLRKKLEQQQKEKFLTSISIDCK